MKNTDFTPYLVITPAELRKLQWKKGWALSMIGLIVYGALRLFGQTPKGYKGICPYFEIGKNWGGFGMGWFFVCSRTCTDATKMHEVGHGIQNAVTGGFAMLAYGIGSVVRYFWREAFGAKTPYDSWWFEGQATRLGTEYVQHIEKEFKE